ncbi:MAG TPA: glycosyltransferase family 4 protein [Burkholderiales bacterium]|nr:glycosyltransferase family 4 protein [Burkholderiales bacterium]
MPHAIWAPLTAFAATLVIVWWLVRSRFSDLVLDHPNQRSLHSLPVPRGGGIGIHAGIVLAWLTIHPPLPFTLWLAFALLFAVSLTDDLRGVPVAIRFIIYLLAAYLFAADLLRAESGLPAALLMTLALAWMANLYNFMDGADGLAGGMALSGFSFYGIAAWLTGDHPFALANFSIAAAAAAFLIFNFHPARIFMGDVGAVPLGFFAGALGLLGWLRHDWPWWLPPLVFSPFIVDASVTLLRRMVRRERVWQAHRDHYYQRLVQLGWGHRGTAMAEYALMAVCGGAALLMLSLAPTAQWIALGIAAVLYLLLMAIVENAWRRFEAGRRT